MTAIGFNEKWEVIGVIFASLRSETMVDDSLIALIPDVDGFCSDGIGLFVYRMSTDITKAPLGVFSRP